MEPIKLPFLGGAYEGRAKSVNAERCLNFYPEKQGEEWILVGTPGLTLRFTIGSGPVRGAWLFDDKVIMVSGDEVYSITSGHASTFLGNIGSSTGPVGMADNGLNVLIVDGSSQGWYTDGLTVTLIPDVDFEGGTTASFLDGYFIVPVPATGRFRLSDLNSVTSWVDTDFATAEGAPDNIRSAIADHRELWLLGARSTEVWVNTGDADFPFERSTFVEKGIAAAFSAQKHDNSLIWLSEDERGDGLIILATGNYSPRVASPIGVNWNISKYATRNDAISFVYQIEGHEFYVLTFPTANRTWVFDAATKHWHQWSSRLDDNELSRHRANCHVFAFGRHYVGDCESGKVYTIEPEVYTEDGEPIVRDRIGQHLNANNQRIPIASVQIDFDEGQGLPSGQGSDPQASLRWSKDGSRTWSNELTRSVGVQGDYKARSVWRKLGRSRNWSFWLRVSDPIKWIVRNATFSLREP